MTHPIAKKFQKKNYPVFPAGRGIVVWGGGGIRKKKNQENDEKKFGLFEGEESPYERNDFSVVASRQESELILKNRHIDPHLHHSLSNFYGIT
ncbi:hypothetical protein H5410_059117 [Solanum commersonii]|uniref:Uncharacterized protein n=1 Tax=Solanum commersonii TaxID=4109 RepID=A0A9J5W1V7_SOLCO|nr:hypothetical protein H5410_059117 [Solanum commersonii]